MDEHVRLWHATDPSKWYAEGTAVVWTRDLGWVDIDIEAEATTVDGAMSSFLIRRNDAVQRIKDWDARQQA